MIDFMAACAWGARSYPRVIHARGVVESLI